MSYKLIDANNIAFNSDGFITAENIVKMPCIYADLPNGMDGEHYVLEQQPKTGHWIFQKIKYGEHLAPMRMWCSNCNSAFDLCCNQIKRYDEATKKEYLWGHCPWCGARMFEPQESEDKE